MINRAKGVKSNQFECSTEYNNIFFSLKLLYSRKNFDCEIFNTLFGLNLSF